MKFIITMKDPDGFSDSIDRAVNDSTPTEGLSDDELDLLRGQRADAIEEMLSDWFRYSETVDIEIDLEANTATVLKAR